MNRRCNGAGEVMNPDKHKTNEAFNSTRKTGVSTGHAQFTPLHLAFVGYFKLFNVLK